MNRESAVNLHQAAQGKLDVIGRLLAAGEDVNRLDADGRTPLYFAAASRRPAMVQLLLEYGAAPDGIETLPTPDSTDHVGPVFDEESESDDLQTEDEDADGDVDGMDDEDTWIEEQETIRQETPLLAACEQHGDQDATLEVVRLLITAGANVNAAGDNGATPLMLAAWREWPEVVEVLVAAGADVNLADEEGTTPLLAALSVDNNRTAVARMVHTLLTAGADIHHADDEGQTPLMLASAFGYVELVRTLLDMGADTDAEDLQERNALTRAAESLANLAELGTDSGLDPDEILAGFEQMGVDPESYRGRQMFAALQNRHGPGSLTWTLGEVKSEDELKELRETGAAWLNEIVELLVERGCQIDHAAQYLVKAGREDLLRSASGLDAPNPLGQTALTEAVAEGAVDRVRKLLEIGANPNARNYLDQSPLGCVPVTRRGRECGRLLVAAGADVNAGSPDGLTELDMALQAGRSEKAHLLLDWGADVRAGTPVLWAVCSANQPLLKLLLERGADPNAVLEADGGYALQGFHQGTTPLIRAAADQPLDVLNLLFEAGADVNTRDRAGRSAADMAVEHGRQDIAEWLRERGGTAPDRRSFSVGLLAAAERGEVEQVRTLLAGGADPNVRGDAGLTPLILAAREGHERVVAKLLQAGADVNTCSEPGYCAGNSTALRCAVVRGHTAIVRSLLEAGADTRPSYEYSSIPAEQENTIIPSIGTALHDAVRNGQQEIVKLLLAAGADVHAADPQDETSLVTAVRHRHWQVAERLLAAGARRRDPDGAYLAPLDFVDAASLPEFRESIRIVESLTGTEAEAHEEIPGLVAFTILPDAEEPSPGESSESWQEYFTFSQSLDEKTWKILDACYDGCLARGHLLLHHQGMPGCGRRESRLVHLLPTADKYAALALYHVRGNEVELSTSDIIAWLRDFEQDYPFRLRGVGFDVVDLEFTVPLPDPGSVARRLAKFCPDLIQQNFPSWEALIQHLTTTQRVHLWWD